MTNIAFQDIAGGSIQMYSAHKELKREQRIKLALRELNTVANIKVFMIRGNKVKLICVKRYNQFSYNTQKYFK